MAFIRTSGSSRYCNCVLAPVLLVLAAGLIYTGGAFRIRDHPATTTADVCHAGKCSASPPVSSSSSPPVSPSWSSTASIRAKRGFEPVSARGGFAKSSKPQPPDETKEEDDDNTAGGVGFKKKDRKVAIRTWSKLSKVEDVSEDEEDTFSADESDDRDRVDSDDEAVQIEVEDDDEVVVDDEEEDRKLRDKSRREEEERKKKEEVEKERKKLARELEERRKREKEEQEKRRREEEEKKRKQKELEEERKRKEEERKRKEEEERKRKEEEERKRKEKEKEEKRKREEEERRQREEAERLLREEAERRLREEEERQMREEEERRLKEEEAQRKREEEVRRKREEEERRLREVEEQRLREEEERRLKEEEERRKREEEEERLREEEECRLREEEEEHQRNEEERRKKEEKEKEAERKKKEEEERKRKELEAKEAARKKKEEEERKRKEKEEKEAERKRDEEEDRKRVERVKKEAEEKKKREEEEKRKRSKVKDDTDDEDDDDENEDDEDLHEIARGKAEKPRLDDKDKSKSPSTTKSKAADSDERISTTKPKTKTPDDSAKSKSKPAAASATKKPTTPDQTKPRGRGRAAQSAAASLSLAELNDAILSVPTFVPNFTAVEDPACQQHGKIFLRQLRGYKLWALQMLDSSAKIPSGLLRGNVNQLGDFDQCLGIATRVKVEDRTIRVQGKYCLASMDLYATHPATRLPVNLMQSRALVRGNMRDPGHFVPRFTTVNWALCLPAACSAEDARRSIENALEYYNTTVGIRFVVDVDPDMCYVKEKSTSYSKETIGVLYFYAIFVCLAIVATLRDYFAILQEKGNYSERIIMAFSLKRTLKALFENKEASSSDIGCIHGIRSLSTIALYAAHKLIPTSRMPYANRVVLTEIASNPLSTILRASLFYTDSFLLLSGVLTAYHMAKELTKRGEIRWFSRFIARFIRLTPSLLAVVFWYAFVMEHTGSGPQWNAAVKANADICKENAWINLLYVQNFFPFEEMCATHTHQLALDMQLSLLAPALVFFLQIKPIVGIIVVFFLLQVSATLRYLATTNNNLSLVIFHGMTMKHLYKTANLTYTLPLHRATPYLFGVSLGVILHYTGKDLRIHKIFVIIGWLIALALGSWSLFSPWSLARRDYTYNVEEATHYAVISPIISALALSWTIFACFTDNGGIINRILSSYWMKIFSRLSYAIYLSQFAVFFYNVGTTRYSSEFQAYRAIDLFEAASVISVSVVLTLLFDIPMQEVKTIILELSDSQPVETSETSKESLPEENNVNNKTLQITPREEEDLEPAPGGWNWSRGTFKAAGKSEYEDTNGGMDEPLFRSSRLKRQDIRRQTMIRSEAYDEWGGSSRRTSRSEEHTMDNGRTSRSDYSRMSNAELEDDLPMDNYLHPRERYFSGGGGGGGYTRSPMRDLDAPVFRRSVSRERPMSKEPERDYSNKPLITISKEDDYQTSRSPRSSMPRFVDQQRSLSSESDFDASYGSRRSSAAYSSTGNNPPVRRASAEPRISDEDDWEEDLRIRRNRYLQERVSSQERDRIPPAVVEEESSGADENNGWSNSPKRRSSAEGKMALLKEPLRPGNMELWTVSKMQLGSSQEPDEEELDEELYLQQRREYREQGPPLREEFEGEEELEDEQQKSYASESLPTSFDEEDDVANLEFVLKRDSKRITVQDLSKLPPDEEIATDNSWNKLDVKSNSSGLFKRESIVKSQASEEDPEYLLPERPKLVEQEQEHPFKKAWQMQKSRSEEEGPGGFIVKVQESKPAPVAPAKQKDEPVESKPKEVEAEEEPTNRDGAQSEEIAEADVTCDVTIVWQPRLNDTETDAKSSSYSKSETSSASSSQRLEWLDEDEQYEAQQKSRRKSEEENWTWTERDT